MTLPRTPAQGVSLIEVLVVLVILAVVSSVLVLSIGAADGSARVRQEAIRLAQRLDYACERAELGGRTIGLVVRPDGYAFMRHEGDSWQMENDRALADMELPNGMKLDDGEGASGRQATPGIFCFASGEWSPFQLTLRAGDTDDAYRLRDAWPKPTRIERQVGGTGSWTAIDP